MSDQTTSIRDDELSADEAAYFKSKGTKEPPIVENKPENAAPEPEPAPEDAPAEQEEAAATAEASSEPENGTETGEKSVTGKKKVDFGALREERDRRKALEAQIQKMNEERMAQIQAERIKEAKVNERLMKLMGGDPDAKKAEEKPSIPDPEEDFIAAQKWTMEKIQEREAREAEAAKRQEEQARARYHQEQVVNTYGRAVADAVEADPIVGAAYNHLTAQHYQQLVAGGMSERDAQLQARRDEFDFAQSCLRDRVHPAQRIMAIAKVRGFDPEKFVAAQAPKPTRLDAIAEGQSRNKTLAGAGTGGAPRGVIDMKRLAEMSDDEFREFSEKNGSKGFKKAMGA